MRTACVLAMVAPAMAFVPGTTLVAPKVASSLTMQYGDRSTAIPGFKKPEGLDGTLVGDFGFDPAGFARSPPAFVKGQAGSLKWYREAEIHHGRIAQLAVVGWVAPEWWHFPSNAEYGIDRFADTNPLSALHTVPQGGIFQIFTLIFALEVARYRRCIAGDAAPGDMGLGQKGTINPYKFSFDDKEYAAMELREIKHCRLAMIASIALLLQNMNSGVGLGEQLGGAFTFPEAVAKAGYFFPEGI